VPLGGILLVLGPVGLLRRGRGRESLEILLEEIPVAGKEGIGVAALLGPEEATLGTGGCTLEWAVVVPGGAGEGRRRRLDWCLGQRVVNSRDQEERTH